MSLLTESFKEHNIALNKEQEEKFQILLKEFLDWNSKINLSAIRTEHDIIVKNFTDSALGTKHIDLNKKSVLDLGCGGGYPILPISILTEAKLTGLDSVGKKLTAVGEMAKKLGKDITLLNLRAEDAGQDKKYREQFDIVITRAVAPWPVLLEIALPFVKVGGIFFAYQGPGIIHEIRQYENLEEKLGGTIKEIIHDNLEDAGRSFVVIEKTRKTPPKFPRAVGIPKKNPLR